MFLFTVFWPLDRVEILLRSVVCPAIEKIKIESIKLNFNSLQLRIFNYSVGLRYFGLGLLTKHRIACVLQILDLIQQASQYKQLKKGANEGEAGSTCRFLVVD